MAGWVKQQVVRKQVLPHTSSLQRRWQHARGHCLRFCWVWKPKANMLYLDVGPFGLGWCWPPAASL